MTTTEQPTEREIKEIQLMRQLKEAKINRETAWNTLYEMYKKTPEYKVYSDVRDTVYILEQQLEELQNEVS